MRAQGHRKGKEVRRETSVRSHGKRAAGGRRVKGVSLAWSLKRHGFKASYVPSAWRALSRLSGQTSAPVRHRSAVSVAGWRLRKGEVVSLSVDRPSKVGAARVSRTVEEILPGMRPARRLSRKTVDKAGACTFPILQPRVYGELSERYDDFVSLCSEPGLSMTVRTGAKTREEGIAVLAARGFPFRWEGPRGV